MYAAGYIYVFLLCVSTCPWSFGASSACGSCGDYSKTTPVWRFTGCVIATSRLLLFDSFHLSVLYHVCPLNIYIYVGVCLCVSTIFHGLRCLLLSMSCIRRSDSARSWIQQCVYECLLLCLCVCAAKNVYSNYVYHRLSFKMEYTPSSSQLK
jgi:hypothetical protein